MRRKIDKEALKIEIPVQDRLKPDSIDGLVFEMTDEIGVAAMSEDAKRPHRHLFYEILFVKESDGCHVLDYTAHEKISNEVFLICPGQVHYWEDVTDIKGTQIDFNEDFLLDTTFSIKAVWELNLFREMGGIGVILTPSEMRQMEELIRMMNREYRDKEAEYASVVHAYLNIFLIWLFRSYQQKYMSNLPDQRYSTLYENFQKLVYEHIEERQSVRYFADRLDVSIGCLNEQIRRQTGLAPGEFIKKVEIAEMKRLIANTDMSMGEIAKSMGFSDGSYFCRMFKNEIGISPMKFRQACAHRNSARFKKRRRAAKAVKDDGAEIPRI
ncbi:MAG: helix-turn-helix domain-containing protein [Clostridiales Family XIII bacterium]|jgi:AraC-like DNA-binding protein|nr:helix-turn-helix domain-containing protein [Clostridiales Family XIII bacterium]